MEENTKPAMTSVIKLSKSVIKLVKYMFNEPPIASETVPP